MPRPDSARSGPTPQTMPAAVTPQAARAAGTNRTSSRETGVDTTHTRTSGRSFSSRAGPMPSTSPN